RKAKLADATLPKLPGSLRATTRDLLVAHRELYRLTPPLPAGTAIKVGPAAPASSLLAYYREAQRRFRVPWNVLASVNFVESRFGQVAQPERVGRARSDAVHAGDVGTLRTGWERARRTRCDPRRCELPARVRCTTGHASRAACIQPLA